MPSKQRYVCRRPDCVQSCWASGGREATVGEHDEVLQCEAKYGSLRVHG